MADKHPDSLQVLMTTDTIGGVWTYCIHLCKVLRDHGVFFHLVSSGQALMEWQRRQLQELDNVCLYESTYKLEWMDNPWEDINASGEWLLGLETELRPNLIHLNSYSYGALPFEAPVMVVAHSDVFSWWNAVYKSNPPESWDTYHQMVKDGMNGADKLVAPSHFVSQQITKFYGSNLHPQVIYNAVHETRFYAGEKMDIVLAAGRIWDEAKNVKALINASSRIRWKVRIAGETGIDGAPAIDTNNVKFVGKLSSAELASEMSRASIFVLPAKYEPFGLSALEAALCQCALVLGDIPSLREIWGDAAVYVNTDDPVEIADTINALIQDKELLNRYGLKARQQALSYSSQRFCSNYLNEYQALVKQATSISKTQLV